MNSKFETIPHTDVEAESTTDVARRVNWWKIISFTLCILICILTLYPILMRLGVVSCPRPVNRMSKVNSALLSRNEGPERGNMVDLEAAEAVEKLPENYTVRQRYGEKLVILINNDDVWKWKAVMNDAFSRSEGIGIPVDSTNLAVTQFPIVIPKETVPQELAPMPDSSFKPPASFDLRKRYPRCSHLHQPTINQGRCGSCWVVAATSMLSDRICIATNQSVDIQLSAADVLTCSGSQNQGCTGGFPAEVINYLLENGLPTGGSYGSEEGCRPYEHDAACGSSPCTSQDWDKFIGTSKECQKSCRKGYHKRYDEDKYHFHSAYRLSSYIYDSDSEAYSYDEDAITNDTKRIQFELMTKGPVVACFHVYADFLLYSSGVYEHTGYMQETQPLYGHCARVIGWGEESGIGYWLVSNSWGRDWGEAGFFKIRRRNGNVRFEHIIMYAIDPEISTFW